VPEWMEKKAERICRRLKKAGKLKGSFDKCKYGLMSKWGWRKGER